MNKLSKKILLLLIKKYIRSIGFFDIKKTKKIYLSLKDDILGNLYSSSFNNDDEYKESFKELKASDFVRFENENTPEFKIVLNLDKFKEICRFLGFKNPKDTLKDEKLYLENLLLKYKNNEVLQAFLQKSIQLVNDSHMPKSLYKNHESLEIILKGINGIMENKDSILLRNLSIKLFADSKMLEKYSDQIFQKVKQFSPYNFSDFYDFCDHYNVNKNVGFVYVKGNIKIKLNGETIDLNNVGDIFAIPSSFLNENLIDEIRVLKVMTIENETTFNYFTDSNYLYVFSKGHPTHRVVTFLKLLHEFNPNLNFYHCGDIDWGGFNIYFDLVEKTGINFELFNMDIETLKKYQEYTKPLTETDKRNLISLKEKDKVKENSSISETIDYMLQNNLKLEQEAFN